MNEQFEFFKTVVNQVENRPTFTQILIVINGWTICNAIRLGISLYGYYPSQYVKDHVKDTLASECTTCI